jgi:23S rRNA pseudouridine1911/1915/1917 synthase
VLVDGQQARPRDKVRGGESVELQVQPEVRDGWSAEAIPLPVMFEDDDLIVIDKPAGLVVHPGAGNAQGTLANALLHRYPELESLPRAGIVHRLDKDTSGLLVAARSLRAHHSLVKQLQARTVSREYEAIVHSLMIAGGTVEAPLGRHARDRTRQAVVEDGRSAVTHYRVLRRFRAHTHIRLKLETGRTHQIRVHMAHIGYPLVGDPVYGGRPRGVAGASATLIDMLRNFRRQALHASRLSLLHPADSREMSWTSPLPADMATLLQALAADCPDSPLSR